MTMKETSIKKPPNLIWEPQLLVQGLFHYKGSVGILYISDLLNRHRHSFSIMYEY